jgi:hypothetical protein
VRPSAHMQSVDVSSSIHHSARCDVRRPAPHRPLLRNEIPLPTTHRCGKVRNSTLPATSSSNLTTWTQLVRKLTSVHPPSQPARGQLVSQELASTVHAGMHSIESPTQLCARLGPRGWTIDNVYCTKSWPHLVTPTQFRHRYTQLPVERNSPRTQLVGRQWQSPSPALQDPQQSWIDSS